MIERQINKKNNISDIEQWAINGDKKYSKDEYYCPTRDIFQARLSGFLEELRKKLTDDNRAFLLTAIVGEIGNNSFDHNLGNWPDIPGIFCAYDLKKKEVILADRGQGVLKTLKRIKPELANHQDALMVAFTEIISGRAPESRGNGLKFVREVVVNNEIRLFFQTGDARLKIQKDDSNLDIKKTLTNFRGCLARIKF